MSRKPKIKTGTSANVTMLGVLVAPAKDISAPTRVRHQVLDDELWVARRLMMAWSMFICAVTAGLSAGHILGRVSSAMTSSPYETIDRNLFFKFSHQEFNNSPNNRMSI